MRGSLFAILVALLVTMKGMSPAPAQNADGPPYHPMDALTVEEVLETVKLLRQHGHADDTTRFPEITLKELPKEKMLAWRTGMPFERRAFVVSRHGGETFETVVDLTAGRIESRRPVAGVQPAIMNEEWERAQALVKQDPRWIAAMKKRDIADLDAVYCAPMSAGRLSGEEDEKRRLFKVPCYDTRAAPGNPYGRPIEGVIAVVDVDRNEVATVVDSGAVRVPPPLGKDEAPAERTYRSPMKPVLVFSPAGVNYSIRGGLNVTWQNWSFHVRAERRFGPVFSLVTYSDGGTTRSVAYQMMLSEMFVPYMDPDPNWAFRTPMDAGEFGLGYLASSLAPGRDCPRHSTFISVVMPSDTGGLFKVDRGLCVFERNTGDPLWRHATDQGDRVFGRPYVELVVRMIPTIGNYDYVVDWIFTQHGNIRVRVGATGYDAVKTVRTRNMKDQTAAEDTRYGELIAPNTVAIYHDHLFAFRLDLDVDGTGNTLIRDRAVPVRLPEANARRSIWKLERSEIEREGPVRPTGHDEIFRVVNPQKSTPLGHRPGYQIEPGHGTLSLLSDDDLPQRRAAFSAERLWLTRYRPDELFASGRYANQSRGGEGLPAYVQDEEAATDTDIVLWYTVGFHHITKTEDWPILSTRWHEFTLRPFNFFGQNPSLDVAPRFARPGAAQ